VVSYLNPGLLEFDAVVTRSGNTGSSAHVSIPGDLKQLFGTTGRIPVSATFDGIPYRGSIVRWAGPPLIIVLQEILRELGKAPGDTLHVTLELDTLPRVVELDDDIETALKAANELDAYRALAYSHQRQFMVWIDGAKQEKTRRTRIEKTVAMVSARKTIN